MKNHIVRIAITGPECAGKTLLAEALAHHYGEPVAAEYAREYLAARGPQYSEADLVQIAKGQVENEEEAVAKAQGMAFFDTDMLVMKIWAFFRFGNVPFLIDQAHNHRPYHLRLLCRPDLPWEPDPLRESPDQDERDLLFGLFESQLKAASAHYAIIQGEGATRLEQAIQAIGGYMKRR